MLLASLSFASDPADLECCYFLGTRDLTDAELKSCYPSAQTEVERVSGKYDFEVYHVYSFGPENYRCIVLSDTWIYKVVGVPDDPKAIVDPWGLYAVETVFSEYGPGQHKVYRWPTYRERYNAWWNPSWKSVEEYKGE